MTPPMTPDERKTVVERLDSLEHTGRERDSRQRRSVEDGKFAIQEAINGMKASAETSEARDAEIVKKIDRLATRQHGSDLELARQGGDLTKVVRRTSTLEGWLPVLKLVIQAITAIAVAWMAGTAASRSNEHPHDPEPVHTAAPMHP